MTVHCTKMKNYEGKHYFKCLNLILNSSKLEFYTSRTFFHSKRKKLGMFILFQKYQFVYPNKLNSLPIRQFLRFQFLDVM